MNYRGNGLFSDELTVLAASEPGQIDPAPVTTVENTYGDVVITWSEPDNRGSALLSYVIEIKNSLDAWVSPTCRQAVSTVFANRECHVAMLTLSSSPFELDFNALIEVRLSSINGQG